jgi:serine/threonine protein kinase
MHKHHIAHLDISLRNLLTDCKGHYAYIDFELSRRFDVSNPRITGRRGTELPPECSDGAFYDPYKVDVWALGVLILRVSKVR